MKDGTAETLDAMIDRFDALRDKLIELRTAKPVTIWSGRTISPEQQRADFIEENSAMLEEALADAMRYRLYQFVVYEEQDTAFDAYDPMGMDTDLADRLVQRNRAKA